jgi:hypothetical protein
MSPRAAWRLEALGFAQVHDDVAGKADWLAHGLPREGERAAVPYAGDLVDTEPPTCTLHDTVGHVSAALDVVPDDVPNAVSGRAVAER